jgi:membrane-associated phospholipid phosphatase
MKSAAGKGFAPTARGLLAPYRLQARLMWEWRPTRLAIVRRAILAYLMACLALAIADAVVPGLSIDSLAVLLLAALLLLALDSFCAVVFHWLLVAWPIFVAQALGLAVQFAAILVLGRTLPGVRADDTAAFWGTVLLTVLNSLFAELVAVSDDDSYYSVLVRRLVSRNIRRPAEPVPGLLVVQIDGLSLPILKHAIGAGRVPVLGGLVRAGDATLHPWTVMLPPTTPASQAGILHGRNDGIAGFRWYEKPGARLMVANHPEDAAEIVRRVSDGAGFLADDGASIGNLVTGDAPRSYLTMATITSGDSADGDRRLRGFFVTTVNYIRLLVLMAGEIAKELYQAERQRGRSVEPRMHRNVPFAVERAATNIALRTVSTALVIEEMYGSAPAIYVDYTGYDAIAHHCGPERVEAIDALEGIDRAIGSLLKAARYTSRPYRLVVLSDHGQCLGATFQQRYGQPLEVVIAGLLPRATTVVGTTDSVESAGIGRRIAAEIGRGPGLSSLVLRLLPRGLRGYGGGAGSGAAEAPPDVVVASSGNLAHVYFMSQADRMTDKAIEKRYPGVIEALASHPGIGALVVRSAAGHPVVRGPRGRLDLAASKADGGDVLADYGPGAAENLRHLAGFDTAGDLILLGAVDRISGEVTGFEELIGSHGGLGGWQTAPFILCPSTLKLAEDPPVGAPAIYQQLTAWRAQLQGKLVVPDGPSASKPSAAVAAAQAGASSSPARASARVSSARVSPVRVSPPPRSRLMLLAGGFIALFACLLALGAIAEDVHDQEANALDSIATPLLHSLSSPALDAVMQALTDLGSTLVVAPLFAVSFALLIWRRHRREALFLAVSVAGSTALNQSLKLIFQRPRPQLAWAQVQPEYSFPSGHAMNSIVFYVALALIVLVLWSRRAGLVSVGLAIVLALLIGTSRIYLGYHYFTDVVGGLLAGAAWLLIVLGAFDGGLWLRGRRAGASGASGP